MDRKKRSLRHFCGFSTLMERPKGIQKEDVFEELLDQFDSFCIIFFTNKSHGNDKRTIADPSLAINHVKND